jgi:hypothetical protein
LEKKITGTIPAFAVGPRKTKKDLGKPRKTQENQEDPGKLRRPRKNFWTFRIKFCLSVI